MENEDSRGPSAVENLGWLALGALIGASAAILLAPAPGRHTRKRLAQHARTHGQSFVDSSQDFVARGRELFEKGREIAQEASEMFERGKKMAETQFDEALEQEHIFDRSV